MRWGRAGLLAVAVAGCADPVTAPRELGGGVGGPPEEDPAVAVCEAWVAARADRAEPAWRDGSVARCEAGTLAAEDIARVVRQVNAYRALAGLPPVTDAASKNDAAQRCALLMHANRGLSHFPPASWDCHDPLGATAARLSNLATAPAIFALDLYMFDTNVPELGHRRWILSNTLGPIGVGSTSAFSCLHVLSGDGDAGRALTTWPPEGPVPLDVLRVATPFGGFDLDRDGWSVQSDTIDLSRATVSVTRDGAPVDVSTRVLPSGYGSRHGLAIHPEGFATEVGLTYAVTLAWPGGGHLWTFTPVDCAAP